VQVKNVWVPYGCHTGHHQFLGQEDAVTEAMGAAMRRLAPSTARP
jgi:hypothetical protein